MFTVGAETASFQRNMKAAADSVKGIQGAIEYIKWDAFTNLAQKAASTVQQVFSVLEKASEGLQLEKTFYAMANAAGVSGAAFLDSMNKTAQGTISDMALMTGAIEGLRGHLSPDMIEKLTAASLTFAAATGVTTKQAFEGLMNAIETGRLRSLGALGENFKELNIQLVNYATALGLNSVQELTAAQTAAALYQISLQLAKGLQASNVALTDQFIAIQQAKAAWDNFFTFLQKVALGAWAGITAAFWRGVGVIQNTVAALMDVVGQAFGLVSTLPGLDFLKEYQGAAEQGRDKILALAKANNEYAKSLEKTGPALFNVTDIAGRGTPLPSLPGKTPPPQNIAGLTKDWIAEEKKLYDADIANLKAYAELAKTETERALSELDVMRAQHLVTEEDYITQKANTEQEGTAKLQKLLEDEKITTTTSYGWMESTLRDSISKLQGSNTKKLEETKRINIQIVGLEDDKQKRLSDLDKQGYALREQGLKSSDQKVISETQMTDAVLVASHQTTYNKLQAQLEGETKLAQARASAGEIRPGEAATVEYQNQLKLLDAQKDTLETQLYIAKSREEEVNLESQLEIIEMRRNALIKEMAVTLKSETFPAYQGLIDGFKKYTVDLGTGYTQMENLAKGCASGMESAFTGFFSNIFDKSTTFSDKMKKLFQDMGQAIINELMKALVVKPLVGSLTGGGTGIWGSLLSSIFGSKGGGSYGFGEANVLSMGTQYQHGTSYVPQTGPAILHKGEAVIPANRNRGGGDVNTTNVFIQATDVNSFQRLYGPTIESIYFGGKRFNKVAMRNQ
jgi:hypothetical protein